MKDWCPFFRKWGYHKSFKTKRCKREESIFLPDGPEKGESLRELVKLMARLRAPGGCPWDQKQTWESLRRYILEEAYELVDAIDQGLPEAVLEECGDLLLQVVFVSEIAQEQGFFDIDDVIEALRRKLVYRHPHVFGDVVANDAETVLRNWELLKSKERERKQEDASLLAGIPRGLPALLRALRLQERASKVGFDWPKGKIDPLFSKIQEELDEVREAIASGKEARIEEELGDLLFAVVNLVRVLGMEAESALQKANDKFSRRFRKLEEEVKNSGNPWRSFSPDELDGIWERVKEEEGMQKGDFGNSEKCSACEPPPKERLKS